MKQFSISAIYSVVAPYAAPAPSMYVMGLNVYHSILDVAGPSQWVLAAFVALVGMIGIESTGGLSAILVSRAFVQKSWGTMKLALGAVSLYAGFVAWGIYSSDDSRPMISTVAITLLAYCVVALWEGLKALETKAQTDADLAVEAARARQMEAQARVNELEAERKLTNSKIRLEKASSGQVDSRPVVSSGQNGQTGQASGQYNQAILEQVLGLVRVERGISTRKIIQAGVGIASPQSALRYRTRALELIDQESMQP